MSAVSDHATAEPRLTAPTTTRVRPASTLRRRILAVVIGLDIICALAASVVVVANARKATQVEIAASMEIAEPFVRETVTRLQRDVGRIRSIKDVDVDLPGIRHVRIVKLGPDGRAVASAATSAEAKDDDDDDDGPPAWFASLIAGDGERREIPVVIAGQKLGSVLVHGEASDEIEEVWEDVATLGGLFLVLNAIAFAAFAFALGRLLAPLKELASGLSDLEHRRLERRLPIPRSAELTALALRFNALAAALSTERATNTKLSLRMVTLQDEERRQIANELHDELGPCLFGLRANLGVLEGDVAAAGGLRAGAGERLATALEISERLQTVNSRLLRKLRPMALGHSPLAEVLGGLIAEFERRHPERTLDLAAEGLADGYGPVIDLTVYRCVQEGVTNALRHAACMAVRVTIDERPNPGDGAPELAIRVLDDGDGVPETVPLGFGLLGLGERLHALGGRFVLHTVAEGAALDIAIPLGGERTRMGPSQ